MAAALYAALLDRYERDRLERWHDGATSAPPLPVMLVDDHQVVRDRLKLLLADQPEVVVCAEAASAREAVATAARALLDVIVMDVRLSTARGSRPPATSAPPARPPRC